jgi:hypothetical protein
MSKAPSRLRWALLSIPLLGIVELVGQQWATHRAPSFDAWAEVEAPVRALKQAGDLVVIAPEWADPPARRALGDELMPLRDVARPDETRYAHAIEVSILGERAPELRGWRELRRSEQGKFLIRRLENPAPQTVIYDFVDHARPGEADVRGTDPPVVCAWNPHAPIAAGGLGGHPTFPAERFECPAGMFFNVGVTVIADEEFRPRRCLWSHPLARGELVTRFHDVPLGSVIRGHGGLYWMIERERKGAPVTLTVRVDGDTVGAFTHNDGEGWKGFEVPLGAHAGQRAREVELAVSSTNYKDRHFCFEADTR